MNTVLHPEVLAAAAAGLDPSTIWNMAGPIVGALAIFLLGFVIASLAANLTGRILRRSQVDSYLASNMRSGPNLSMARIAKTIVFWLILLIAVVAALNVLNLTTASAPLNNLLNQVFSYLPKLASAIGLGLVAWVLGTVAKMLVMRAADSWKLDERLNELDHDHTPENLGAYQDSMHAGHGHQEYSLSKTMGNVVYGFVFLFFLPLILGVLDLQGPLAPVQNLLNQFLSALPLIFKASVIAVVGWFVAKILRDVVTNLLVAAGVDRLSGNQRTNGAPLSRMGGMVVFVLTLIPVAIAALDALAIPAISAPATSMLNQVLSAVPLIATAGVILAGAYFVGRYVADLVVNLLDSFGFNGLFRVMGFEPPVVSGGKSPSEVAGMITLVGIMLFATVAATNVLNIPALTAIVTAMTYILGRVLFGLVIFGVGLYLANLVYRLVTSSGSGQAMVLGQVARISILVLVSAMALQQMGIAENIVNLAFGLVLGSLAVAAAIAFGLGGRDVAGKHLDRWLNSFQSLDNRGGYSGGNGGDRYAQQQEEQRRIHN
jgi:hypothetical protein